MINQRIKIFLVVTFSILLAACGNQSTPTPSVEEKATQLMILLDAKATASAGETAVAQLTQIAAASSPTPIAVAPTATAIVAVPTATTVVIPPTAPPPPHSPQSAYTGPCCHRRSWPLLWSTPSG